MRVVKLNRSSKYAGCKTKTTCWKTPKQLCGQDDGAIFTNMLKHIDHSSFPKIYFDDSKGRNAKDSNVSDS